MTRTKKIDRAFSTFDEEIANRIAYAVKRYGSQKEVAKKIGITHNQLYRWSKGLATPNFKSMVELANLTGVSVNFLAAGSDIPAEVDADFISLKPLGEIMGNNHCKNFSSPISFRLKWLNNLGLNAKNAALFEARGDSMEPTIKDGSTLLLRLDDTSIKDGFIYVIQMEEQIFVRRLKRDLKNIHVMADNPQYQTEFLNYKTLEKDMLKIIGRVVWCGTHV